VSRRLQPLLPGADLHRRCSGTFART
jgi:hypothetical protein